MELPQVWGDSEDDWDKSNGEVRTRHVQTSGYSNTE